LFVRTVTVISSGCYRTMNMHSYKFFFTASSEVTNFPEFVAVGMVDDIQIGHYDSNTKRAEPKQDWMKKVTEDEAEYWEWLTQRAVVNQQRFKVDLDTFKQRFNQTGGLQGDPAPPGRGVTPGPVAGLSAAPPVAAERREAPEAAAETSSAAARTAASERPIAAPRSAPRLAAAVSDLEHGVVSMNDVHGVGENNQGSEGEVLGDVVESEVGEEKGSEVQINKASGVSEVQEGMSEEEDETQAEEAGGGNR
uniref:MHC class I-like antigen recognition-like domain-containing protein n=1 Tax=Labrus bergylta TaxID=56723 RepID=A0A3Q3FMI3_9LABR